MLNIKEAIIVDLRSNPGGLLTNAIYIANMLLKDSVIVSTVDRDGYKETQRSLSTVLTNQPVVVLINGGSASASEVLAGSLKDNINATLIGIRTYGKGTVQKTKTLSSGAMIKYTVQEWLTPNGNKVNGVGINPDYVITLDEKYFNIANYFGNSFSKYFCYLEYI
mgnify:CR=1 FL=1